MTKSSTADVLSTRARGERRKTDIETQPDWADSEARGFLDRPVSLTPFGKVLRVGLITAMVIAVVKVAWILAFYVR